MSWCLPHLSLPSRFPRPAPPRAGLTRGLARGRACGWRSSPCRSPASSPPSSPCSPKRFCTSEPTLLLQTVQRSGSSGSLSGSPKRATETPSRARASAKSVPGWTRTPCSSQWGALVHSPCPQRRPKLPLYRRLRGPRPWLLTRKTSASSGRSSKWRVMCAPRWPRFRRRFGRRLKRVLRQLTLPRPLPFRRPRLCRGRRPRPSRRQPQRLPRPS